jgi:hypothetical protein
MNTKNKTIAVLMAAIMVSAVVVPMAMAVDVPTSAVITGAGNPPTIEYKWETPDEDPAPKTQIYPNPGGDKDLVIWVVVSDPNGIQDIVNVYVDVYNPDGTLKYQLHAVEVTDSVEIEVAKQYAVDHELITQADADQIDYELSKEVAKIYKAVGVLTHCQPAGMYETHAWATDQVGAQSDHYINDFVYFSIMAFRIDFATIDYKEIAPGKEKIVAGDEKMGTPDHPTIESIGNDPLLLKLHADPLIGDEKGKMIVDFDAKFLDEKIYFVASEWVTFATPLEGCQIAQIDFSVLAPYGTPADTYSGTMTLLVA